MKLNAHLHFMEKVGTVMTQMVHLATKKLLCTQLFIICDRPKFHQSSGPLNTCNVSSHLGKDDRKSLTQQNLSIPNLCPRKLHHLYQKIAEKFL